MLSPADLGLAVFVHRELRGWRQSELAAAAGVSDKTISAWKTGRRNPNRKALLKVARALELPLADIEALAAVIGRFRLRRELAPAGAGPSGTTGAAHSTGSLSLDELHLEMGRACALLVELAEELRSRREKPGPSSGGPDAPAPPGPSPA